MAQKNTTEIGDDFENRALGILEKALSEDQLGHNAQFAKIYRKKKYRTLNGDLIEFDLTIEIWPPEAPNYTFIYIIECKNYSTTIPAKEMQSFHSQLMQLGKMNMKPIFISNAPLQKRPLSMAKSLGMMVIEGQASDNYKITVYKKDGDNHEFRIPFLVETYDSSLLDEGSQLIEKNFDKAILSVLFHTTELSTFNIDKLSKTEIENIANDEFSRIHTKTLSANPVLNVELLIKYLFKNYGASVEYVKSDYWGACDLQNNVIYLNQNIKGTNRELFILSHEFGHLKLHYRLSMNQATYDMFKDSEYNFKTDKHELSNSKNWIEWQANYFASCLTMPKTSLSHWIARKQGLQNNRIGKIYLDDQPQNRKDFYDLIKHLAYVFNVSQTSILYRLNELGLINDQSRLKPIRKVVSEFMDDLIQDYFV